MEALGRRVWASRPTPQVYNALTGAPTTKQLAFQEPLVRSKDIDGREAQAKLKHAYPPPTGQY